MSICLRTFAVALGAVLCTAGGCGGAHANHARAAHKAAPPVPVTADDLAAADKACDAVAADACVKLAIDHELAHQLPDDDPIARRLLARGCDRGSARACTALAEDEFVVSGGSVEAAGVSEAERAAQRGCTLGNPEACDVAGRLALAVHDETEAVSWEQEACHRGLVWSCRYLVRRAVAMPDTDVDVAALYREECAAQVTTACEHAGEQAADPTPAAAPATSAGVDIPPQAFEALRQSGSLTIAPDDNTRTQVQHIGSPKLSGAFRVCLAPTGEVATVDIRKPTGAIAFDRKIERSIFGWRFKPYTAADGTAAPACSTVDVTYQPPRSAGKHAR